MEGNGFSAVKEVVLETTGIKNKNQHQQQVKQNVEWQLMASN
jgi:hypothetical protein